MKNIVIFGAPGSGKGTQSDLMIKKYGLSHISTGDVLRNEIKNGTELGKTAKGYIDNGQLIPDELRRIRNRPRGSDLRRIPAHHPAGRGPQGHARRARPQGGGDD